MKLAIFSLLASVIITTQYTANTAPSLSENSDPNYSPYGQTSREQRIKHFRLDKNRVAIDGYDPVSYFKVMVRRKAVQAWPMILTE